MNSEIKHYSKLLYLVIIILISSLSFGQNLLDSLRTELAKDPQNPTLLNDLASALIPDSIFTGREIAHQALIIATQKNNNEEQARAFYTIGDSWWYASDYPAAIPWFEKSGAAWQKAGNLLEAATCYNDVGYSSSEIDRFDVALRSYKKSLGLLLEINNEEYLAAVLTNIGRVYQGLSKYDSAIFYNEQAIALSDVPGQEEQYCSALGNLGLVYKNMGDYQKALEYYTRAHEIAKQMNFTSLIAVDLNNIAAIYVAWGKLDLAADYFWQALAIDEQTGNLAQAEMTLNNLAHVIHKQGYSDSALVIYHEALSLAERLGRYGNAAVRKMNIGSLYFDKKNYPQAINYFTAGIKTCEELGLVNFTAGGYSSIAAAYLETGDFKQAELSLSKAENISLEINAFPTLQKVFETQAKLYEKTGRLKKSLESYRKFTALKDSLFNEQSQEKLVEMQARYETEKKQQQIELLIKNNQLQKSELHQKQFRIVTLGIGIAILALSAIIVWLMFIQKSRAHRKLVEKNLELIHKEESLRTKTDTLQNKQSLSESEKFRILQILDELMKSEKVFIHKQISLSDLATRTETNTTYLSRIINEEYQMNFPAFLNSYRVKEAQRLFAENKHLSMSLEGIADMVGYQSRSTFNTTFKKITGVTPTIYLKKLKEIKETK